VSAVGGGEVDELARQTNARNLGPIAGSDFMCVTVLTAPNVAVKIFFTD